MTILIISEMYYRTSERFNSGALKPWQADASNLNHWFELFLRIMKVDNIASHFGSKCALLVSSVRT